MAKLTMKVTNTLDRMVPFNIDGEIFYLPPKSTQTVPYCKTKLPMGVRLTKPVINVGGSR